jgi:flagella basal body P-ring formation protein FlgA
MNQSFKPLQSNQPGSTARACEAAIYMHPSDVMDDPKLTLAEKRAVLASWISDARAVENAPSLRQLDSGAVVEVDAIRQALVLLD